MKPNRFFIIIALLAVVAILIATDYVRLSKSTPAPEAPSPQSEPGPAKLEPEFLEGAFIENQEQRGTFIQPKEAIEISLQKAKEGKTVAVSWDESKIRVFHIVLLNTDFTAIWLLSALGALPKNIGDIQRQDISFFLPPGYALGDRMEGFQSFEEPEDFELALGQKYYLQMFALTQNDQAVSVNKTFVFTSSCLPPDCK